MTMPALTLVKKPLETYLTVRESDGDREMTAAECEAVLRAVNAHDELVAALKGVLAAADRETKEFDAARAAIAKAESVVAS